jgi:hypothetical protein
MPQEITSGALQDRASQTDADRGLISIFRYLKELMEGIHSYGLATAVFALPLVVACFGLYFLYEGVNTPVVNMAKVGVGGFTLLFGSGLLFGLLYWFDKRSLWDKLKGSPKAKTSETT